MLFIQQTLAVFASLLLLLTGCAVSTHTQTPIVQIGTSEQPLEISGVLPHNLQIGGYIRITGDLIIPAGLVLQVEPGSRLLIVGTDSTKIDPEFLDKGTEILVRGKLLMNGRPDTVISVSLDEETPTGERWTGFELVAAEEANFSYVDIIGAELGILSIDSMPQLEQVNILGSRYGLLLQGESTLSYNHGRVSGGDAGLLCFDQSTLLLSSVHIADNLEEGLYLAEGCSLVSQQLEVVRNDIGLVARKEVYDRSDFILAMNRVDFKSLPVREFAE